MGEKRHINILQINRRVPKKQNRETIEQLILKNGHSRYHVTDLFLDVQVETIGD